MNSEAEFFAVLRRDFPMLQQKMHDKPLIYLDTAATAQKPQVVIDALTDFYSRHYATVHRAAYQLSKDATDRYDAVRCQVQRFLNAPHKEEIIFTRGTTASINLVARSFGKAFISAGDEIVISEIEHHSNIVPWQMVCKERGALLRVVPVNDRGELNLDLLEQMLGTKTKLVAIAHLSNALGTLHPIRQIAKLAHRVDAKLLVDGAQAAGHLPIDVQALDCDFYAFSGHKAYGPTSIGVLWGRQGLLEKMPPDQGGGDMVETVDFPQTIYRGLPLKFEAGTPMIAEIIGLGAALDYLSTIGKERIVAWEHQLLTYATKKLQEIPGLRIIGTAEQKGAIISFFVTGVHPLDIGTLLDLQGIAIRTGFHCAQPAMRRFGVSGTARLSFGLYNTFEEIDQLIISLKEIVSLLQ